MVNFRQPYLATSLQDFWRRWHISLSTWLRDYLYIPLGGSRDGEGRTYRNLMLTMLLGGLWHGANWTFVVWGAIHGAGLSVERAYRRLLRPDDEIEVAGSLVSVRAWVSRIVVFHLACAAWIFFRAASLRESVVFLRGLTSWTWAPEYGIALRFLALFAAPLFVIDLLNESRGEEYLGESLPEMRRVAVGVAMMCLVTLLAANQLNAFIYFRF